MRCVCQHIRALHVDGVCQARVRPCGCRQYETEEQADKPSTHPKTDTYTGIYSGGKRWQA